MNTSILQQIQLELKAPKNQYNSFGKYSYRNAEDIQEALKPILAKHNCCVTIHDDIVQLGDRFYVKAIVQLHGPDMKLITQTTGYAREPESRKGMDDAQVTGATSSYARKYALGGMFLLDDTKDADYEIPTNNKKEPIAKPESKSHYETYLSHMSEIKKQLSEFPQGEDGYYKALEIHGEGAKHANAIKSLDVGRKVYSELKKYLEKLQKETV